MIRIRRNIDFCSPPPLQCILTITGPTDITGATIHAASRVANLTMGGAVATVPDPTGVPMAVPVLTGVPMDVPTTGKL